MAVQPHAISAKVYVNEAHRDSDLMWQSTRNLNKVVKLEDTDEYFVLASVGPSVWQSIGNITNTPDASNAGEAGMTFFADGSGGGEWIRVPGWAQYSDQDVTVGSPSQSITTGVRTLWTNDGVLTTIERPPSDLTVPMWNVSTNKIIPITSFDTYISRLTFSAENYSGVTPYIIIELDIGGSLGVIWSETTPLLKGGNQQDISVTIPFFTGATFIANGGSIYLTYVGGTDCDLFKSSIFIGRESKNFI